MRFWEILRGYFPLALEITDKWTWFRARKCADAEGYGHLDQMLYPPADLCTGYGRANPTRLAIAVRKLHARDGARRDKAERRRFRSSNSYSGETRRPVSMPRSGRD